ncbi:unnamed protein product [marine sediment metagenome]|uniref:Uncharacterized protein n=1 Tax=marine sediment metagenome TaxID=412755 RepID=X1R3H0_9ZZZZ
MKKMIETYYRILKHDPEGNLIKDSGLIPSRSYVIQFLEMLEGFFKGEDKTATDVLNAAELIVDENVSVRMLRVLAQAGDDSYGTVVGTNAGVTAVNNENYKLDTKILHSDTEEAEKLNYQAVTLVVPTANGGNVDFDITRTFLNETENPIGVKEIGIICRGGTGYEYFLLLRDVVTEESVLAGYTLTVIYTLRTTVEGHQWALLLLRRLTA